MESFLQWLFQSLYEIFTWQYFGVFAIVWILVDLIWVKRWKLLLERIGKIIVKPIIFKNDDSPQDPTRLYPRVLLEQLASVFKSSQKSDSGKKSNEEIDDSSRSLIQRFISAQGKQVFNVKHPLRTLGYIISLAFFLFFIFADTVTIAQTMELLGLMGALPEMLQRLDLAILGGALLSAVVGVWIGVEMAGDGELINTKDLKEGQKRIWKTISILVIFFSVLVMIALAFQRLIYMGQLESSTTSDIILAFILYGLLAINNSLSAALTFTSAASGIIVVLFIAAIVFLSILPIAAFTIDITWRTCLIIIDLLVWLLFTPIIAIAVGIMSIFRPDK